MQWTLFNIIWVCSLKLTYQGKLDGDSDEQFEEEETNTRTIDIVFSILGIKALKLIIGHCPFGSGF